MNLITLMRKIAPYVRPYKWLVVATLLLTLIGSLIAQVNAIVLDRTVDAINALVVPEGFEWSKAAHILTIISIILLGKEVLAAIIRYAQNYFGERMRIFVSKDLSQAVVDRILSYRMAFFSRSGNETGRLQTRIDQGVPSPPQFRTCSSTCCLCSPVPSWHSSSCSPQTCMWGSLPYSSYPSISGLPWHKHVASKAGAPICDISAKRKVPGWWASSRA